MLQSQSQLQLHLVFAATPSSGSARLTFVYESREYIYIFNISVGLSRTIWRTS